VYFVVAEKSGRVIYQGNSGCCQYYHCDVQALVPTPWFVSLPACLTSTVITRLQTHLVTALVISTSSIQTFVWPSPTLAYVSLQPPPPTPPPRYQSIKTFLHNAVGCERTKDA